jgi:apolipoprotein N-acyltransferase
LLLQVKTSSLYLFTLALLCPLLLWLAWPPLPTNFVIFFAFVPFLLLEEQLTIQSKVPQLKIVLFSYFVFLLWNILTTWWIWYASDVGAILAIVLNSMLMTLPVFFFYKVKRNLGRPLGYVALVCGWLSFELMHYNWDAPWPWLTLGNAWASTPDWIQWYEYTGVMGGTIWIWVMNILIYELLIGILHAHDEERKPIIKPTTSGVAIGLLIAIPIAISYAIRPDDKPLTGKGNIVVVQPNVDPYSKFDESTYNDQVITLLGLTEKMIDTNTVLVAWPETALAGNLDEKRLLMYPSVQMAHDFMKHHPRMKLLTGIESISIYNNSIQRTPTARQFLDKSAWYDAFNTAMLLDKSDSFSLYHKSRLVPGAEKMPFLNYLGFLKSYSIDLGGMSGSLGSQESPSVFKVNDSVTIAPIICYESVFGEYVSEFVRQGADIITIITNDGWWHNTPGHRQHLLYGALRAIENRRFIARSANTGISCYILPSGKIISPTNYWEPAVLKSSFVVNKKLTFYTRYGDYLGKGGFILAIFIMIATLYKAFFVKKPLLKQEINEA